MPDKIIEFGSFRLENAAVYDSWNKQIELPDQAVKVLTVLLEHTLRHGQTVLSNAELLSKAWPGRVVDNNNLHQQIIRLREELGAAALVSTSAAVLLHHDIFADISHGSVRRGLDQRRVLTKLNGYIAARLQFDGFQLGCFDTQFHCPCQNAAMAAVPFIG